MATKECVDFVSTTLKLIYTLYTLGYLFGLSNMKAAKPGLISSQNFIFENNKVRSFLCPF